MERGASEHTQHEGRLPDDETCQRLAAALGPFAVVDLETTGLDPESARVIEVGAILVTPGARPALLQRLVDPGLPIPPITTMIAGLADPDVRGAPPWSAVSRELAAFVRGATIVAHNAAFEEAFLGPALEPGTRFLDTLELACVLRPELPGHSLETLARELLGRTERHRALEDAIDTLAVLAVLSADAAAGGHPELAAIAARVDWGWKPLLGRLGPRLGALDAAAPARVELPEPARRTPIPAEWYAPDFVTALLTDEARWRRHFPSYRARDGQIQLARALLVALREDRVVGAEAGTGIGKTLAYGLVGLLHALHTGERVVVSSANRTLQERVVEEELPRIAAVLGRPRQPALVLKGRANYGCAARANELAERPGDFGFAGMSAAARLYLASYFARCPTRDLQSFGGWLLAQESGLRGVRDVLACSTDCDERICRALAYGTCAYLRRVDALGDATIVSINHSLLLTWPARYGSIDRLVIDEAHELAQEGDRAFREEIGSRDLRQWLGQVAGSGRGGLLWALCATQDPVALRRALELGRRCELAIEACGRALLPVCKEGETLVPAPTVAARDPQWSHAARGACELAASMVELGEEIDRLAGSYREARDDGMDDAVSARATTLALQLRLAGQGLVADLFEQTREGTVYAAQSRLAREQCDWTVRATPLNVAELIHAKLLDPAKTVVAVSATLGVGGNPRPSLDKIGWQLVPDERRLPEMVIPSPFDYPANAVLAFARGGTYRSRGFADDCAQAIAGIAGLLGGRTLALFTSRNRLAEVADRLPALLDDQGIALLVQRRSGGAGRLVDQFAASPRAVLLGTRSLWQGIDVPGEALSCVVIDKLPFPPPNDPLQQGRGRLIRAAGGDEFRTLSLEPAVVSFKQMFGRLVRSESDRGFVVVLGADPAKAYIQEFVASLPGPPRVVVGGMGDILAEMRRFFVPPSAPAAGADGAAAAAAAAGQGTPGS
jgi:Rad3-related DNA helicase/DNA polymerase III epsilon subunit-like protein